MALFGRKIPADPSNYQRQVLKLKEEKQAKHDKSHVRHPIRSVHSGYNKMHDKAQIYWARGQQLGQAQLNDKTLSQIHSRQYVEHYVKNKVPTKTKIIYGLILGVIIIFIFLGIFG